MKTICNSFPREFTLARKTDKPIVKYSWINCKKEVCQRTVEKKETINSVLGKGFLKAGFEYQAGLHQGCEKQDNIPGRDNRGHKGRRIRVRNRADSSIKLTPSVKGLGEGQGGQIH